MRNSENKHTTIEINIDLRASLARAARLQTLCVRRRRPPGASSI